MWAYGAPEIWPEGRYERSDPNGTKHYYPEDRSFYERVFNENSFPLFVLLCILVGIYIIDLSLENVIMKKFFKSSGSVNLKQDSFTNNKEKMREFSEVSYDPQFNPEYNKILVSILDVAQVNKEVVMIGKSQKSFIAKGKTSVIAKRNFDKKSKENTKAPVEESKA